MLGARWGRGKWHLVRKKGKRRGTNHGGGMGWRAPAPDRADLLCQAPGAGDYRIRGRTAGAPGWGDGLYVRSGANVAVQQLAYDVIFQNTQDNLSCSSLTLRENVRLVERKLDPPRIDVSGAFIQPEK